MTKGTIKQFIEHNVQVNGATLTQPQWAVFLQIASHSNSARVVGEVRSESGKGKPSKIWQLDTKFEIDIAKV